MRERRATLGLAPALPGLLLVLIIFWALAAVLMLTGTLINAREIDDDVRVINKQVQPIDKELDNVKLAARTARISERIRVAAQPLTGQLTQVIRAATAIDKTARSILGKAGSINETARAINANARSINATVTSINGNVVSINDQVNSIGSNVASIGGLVGGIGGNVTSINARVGSIFGQVGPVSGARGGSINETVRDIRSTFVRLAARDSGSGQIPPAPNGRVPSIEGGGSALGVLSINQRADRALNLVGGGRSSDTIKADFEGIRAAVNGTSAADGRNHGSGGDVGIHGHANSIDCAPVLNLFGPAPYCGN